MKRKNKSKLETPKAAEKTEFEYERHIDLIIELMWKDDKAI